MYRQHDKHSHEGSLGVPQRNTTQIFLSPTTRPHQGRQYGPGEREGERGGERERDRGRGREGAVRRDPG